MGIISYPAESLDQCPTQPPNVPQPVSCSILAIPTNLPAVPPSHTPLPPLPSASSASLPPASFRQADNMHRD